MKDKPSKVVGLCGYPGVGKNALADYLCEHHGWAQIAFADAMKDLFLLTGPCWYDEPIVNRAELEEVKRDTHSGIRERLQAFGQAIRDISPDFWVEALEGRLDLQWNPKMIITDVRYPNEADYIWTTHWGRVIGLVRDGHGPVNGHESETNTAEILEEVDAVLVNDGTIEELAEKFLAEVE